MIIVNAVYDGNAYAVFMKKTPGHY